MLGSDDVWRSWRTRTVVSRVFLVTSEILKLFIARRSKCRFVFHLQATITTTQRTIRIHEYSLVAIIIESAFQRRKVIYNVFVARNVSVLVGLLKFRPYNGYLIENLNNQKSWNHNIFKLNIRYKTTRGKLIWLYCATRILDALNFTEILVVLIFCC